MAGRIGFIRLSSMAPLTRHDLEIAERSLGDVSMHGRGANLAPVVPAPWRILIHGWACRSRQLADGRRQIFAFLLPGDIVGLAAGGQPTEICSVTTLTPASTVYLGGLRDRLAQDRHGTAGLERAVEAYVRASEAQLLDHMVRIGSQTAYQAIGHLFLELHERLEAVDLARNGRFRLPVGQRVLAEALGISGVHVNRVLRDLRQDGLVKSDAGWIELMDSQRLAQISEYAPRTRPRMAAAATSPEATVRQAWTADGAGRA